ncbi:hypothetical protein UFOVP466_50 [uncultured Caudovirales phage]|uniref:Uncharacterized protein n=1 Tax=uncultured Caudovirales phage TaxID=2100421 RepID=A0A6J5MGU2_9CAUD|nr:hypothetical protein UFOVP466_50 [uncultured Caudovirales phage]CAB4180732.1 hypothetical protein UFOVP1045_97 [uncultured Caudovirales phage]CAB4190329.1 hypothetical protein UFOVP1194_51 [uncultured Caudovirales phage]CAB4221810.1 hypothetical protein UFOVP1641_47 [uncultured Caudovirales phage]
MIARKERLTVIGHTSHRNPVMHAVAITRTTDRDGVRYTEPGFVRSLCEQTMNVIHPEQDAEAMLVFAHSKDRCRNCRRAMAASVRARREREADFVDSELFQKNAAE